jgi:hypothetical protein
MAVTPDGALRRLRDGLQLVGPERVTLLRAEVPEIRHQADRVVGIASDPDADAGREHQAGPEWPDLMTGR